MYRSILILTLKIMRYDVIYMLVHLCNVQGSFTRTYAASGVGEMMLMLLSFSSVADFIVSPYF